MLAWLSANMGTIIVAVILLAVVAVISVKLISDKKKGRSSCGSNCSKCAMAGKCHPVNK